MNKNKWLAAGVSIVIMLFLAVPAGANGAPVKIFLNFLPEFSNYGPTDASGVALVSIGEAWLDLTAEGMPQLEGDLYEAWLIVVDTEEMISMGKFNADTDGRVAYIVELDDLPVVDYRYFVITVEPDPDPSPDPDSRWAIAGVFPNPKLEIVLDTPTPPLQPGGAGDSGAGAAPTTEPGGAGAPPPVTLPVTGGVELWISDVGVIILGIGLGLLGLLFSQRSARLNAERNKKL